MSAVGGGEGAWPSPQALQTALHAASPGELRGTWSLPTHLRDGSLGPATPLSPLCAGLLAAAAAAGARVPEAGALAPGDHSEGSLSRGCRGTAIVQQTSPFPNLGGVSPPCTGHRPPDSARSASSEGTGQPCLGPWLTGLGHLPPEPGTLCGQATGRRSVPEGQPLQPRPPLPARWPHGPSSAPTGHRAPADLVPPPRLLPPPSSTSGYRGGSSLKMNGKTRHPKSHEKGSEQTPRQAKDNRVRGQGCSAVPCPEACWDRSLGAGVSGDMSQRRDPLRPAARPPPARRPRHDHGRTARKEWVDGAGAVGGGVLRGGSRGQRPLSHRPLLWRPLPRAFQDGRFPSTREGSGPALSSAPGVGAPQRAGCRNGSRGGCSRPVLRRQPPERAVQLRRCRPRGSRRGRSP